MKFFLSLYFLFLTFSFSQEIHPKLLGFKDFLGKTWQGEFPNSSKENPQIDVQHWELILQGQAIKIRHSINDGEYGGESILVYNAKKDIIEFYYFTTAGFYTHGTMTVKNNIYTSHEYVIGNEDGITEVKSVATLLENGNIHVKSSYFKKGKWEEDSGHDLVYKLSPESKVKL